MLLALAVILAFVLNLLVLTDRETTEIVAVAATPIPAGAPLAREMIRLVEVPSDFEGLDSLITASGMDRVEGFIVTRSLSEGDLLVDAHLVEPAAGEGSRTMSIPVDREHAVGGGLVVGDTVDVVAVRDGEARWVVAGVEVVAIPDAGQSAFGATSGYHVVVSLEADEALRLAEVLSAGDFELVRSTGAAPVEVSEAEPDG